jgi:sugar/nucleoside kinase (ribokinase family)
MSLVIVGTVAFDAIETPFGKTDKIVGGAATFISIAASYFNKKNKLISVIGDDYDMQMLEKLKGKGIDLEGLQIKKGEKSFFWSGKYHYDLNSRDTLDTQLNVLANFDPIVPETYQDCEYLMLGNLDPNVQMKVIKQLKNRPKLVVLDTMNFWMDIALEPLKEVMKYVDVITINDEEARQLSGEYSLVKAARKILTMGPKYVVIKKGEHGALLFDKQNMFFCSCFAIGRGIGSDRCRRYLCRRIYRLYCPYQRYFLRKYEARHYYRICFGFFHCRKIRYRKNNQSERIRN